MEIDALSQLLDLILDDLSARFIINLPEEELSSVTRICFGLEQAHWFYEDFFRPQHPALPSVNLRAFTAALFSHCPLLWKFSGQHEAAFDDFLKYKIRVPVRGVIMLNQEMNKCVLVKGWKASAGWGFPKGKIDQGEDDPDCAIREVYEECGYDARPLLDKEAYIDMVMKEQTVRLYIVRGVPLETNFETQTRKEISKIDWFELDDLPTYKKDPTKEDSTNIKNNKFYMVAPFLGPLRRWIKKTRMPRGKTISKTPIKPITSLQALPETGPDDTTIIQAETPNPSSQALKLLLGIADAPEVPEKPSSSQAAGAEVEEGSGRIDLASLFHKSSSESDTKPTESSRPSTGVLNTSIEASIWDQLMPARQHQELPQYNLQPQAFAREQSQYRASPVMANHQLPPWMSQQIYEPRNVNHGAHGMPSQAERIRMPQLSHQPLPPPNLYNIHPMHGHSRPETIPPGLQFGHHASHPPPLHASYHASSPPKNLNSNAPALLALLKSNQGPPAQLRHEQHIISPRPLSNIPSQGFLAQRSDNQNNLPPIAHQQSLLALLKPGVGTPAAQQHTKSIPSIPGTFQQPMMYENEATLLHKSVPEPVSSRDAFLLDYLTQAANGSA